MSPPLYVKIITFFLRFVAIATIGCKWAFYVIAECMCWPLSVCVRDVVSTSLKTQNGLRRGYTIQNQDWKTKKGYMHTHVTL